MKRYELYLMSEAESLSPVPAEPMLFPAQWDPKLGIHVT